MLRNFPVCRDNSNSMEGHPNETAFDNRTRACAFALTPTLSASAMPPATPAALGGSDAAVIQVKGGHGHGHGHGHMGRGGRGHHYGWGRGRGHHHGWRHHRHHRHHW